MQAYAETASKAVAEAESALRAAIDTKEPKYDGFEPLLERLRKTSQDYVFLVFPATAAKIIEDRLWDAHVRVNKKFQKHLKYFREDAGRKKHVERRKAEKHYLQFIRASMQFYRGYIQRLASHFKNVPELLVIANKLHLDTSSVDVPIAVPTLQRGLIMGSCHNALMRLGDLSRYRETELETKERNWGPAKGHYQLALSVKPESGAAYNQLAVMALADEDHLRAVYYLHRAAATNKPFPVARDNIRLEFEKLLKQEPEEKSALYDTSKQTLDVLENRFLALQANCHSRPGDFVTYSEKTTQILHLIAVSFEEIKDRSLDKLLQKACLISIIAEQLAWKGVSVDGIDKQDSKTVKSEKDKKLEAKVAAEHERNCQAVYLLQRFNILLFTTLLRITARELASDDDAGHDTQDAKALTVPMSVRRLLPHLRQYSSWLLSNIHSLLSPRHISTGKCLDQFWKAYIKTANLMLSKFPISEIPELEYLLEEDQDTLSFAPFSANVIAWRYSFDNGHRKPSRDREESEHFSNTEMLARIRRFVFDVATITNQKDKLKIDWTPIILVNGEFVFQEKPQTPAPVVPKPSTPSQPFRSRAHAHANSLNSILAESSSNSPSKPSAAQAHKLDESSDVPLLLQDGRHAGQPADNAIEMETMVDDLVSSKNNAKSPSTERYSKAGQSTLFNSSSVMTGTPQVPTNPVTIMDIVRGMQRKTPEPRQPDIMDVVRGMQQRLEGSQSPLMPPAHGHGHRSTLSNASLPGIWNTAFTPRPGEATGSSPRPGSSSAIGPSSIAPRSSTTFQHGLMQQERDIAMRTSPYQQPPFSSWQDQQILPPVQHAQMWNSGPSSPWHSPSARSPSMQQRSIPQTALFGAIGEPRRNESHDPKSD